MASEKIVEGAPLRASVVREGGVSTLLMSGEFDLASLETARAGLDEALDGGSGSLVIDLGQLTFIDSSGIAFLLEATRRVAAGRLSFIPSESETVRRVLRITGVDEAFGGDGDGRAAAEEVP